MPLQDTEEKLYESDSDIEKREHSGSEFDLEKGAAEKISFIEKKSWWNKFSLEWLDDEKRLAIYIVAIVLGIITIGSLVFVAVIKFKSTAFSEERVSVVVEGPDSIGSAKEVTYLIKYKNKNRVALEEAYLLLNHSENFYPNQAEGISIENNRNIKVELGKIRAFGSGEIKISGKFYASENYMIYLQPTLRYRSENFNSFFEATSQFGVRVSDSSVVLAIKSPKEAIDESTIEYDITYENKGEVNLNNLNLRLEYSNGLIFQSATPSPVGGDNVWYLGNLNVGAKGVVKVKSKVDGNQYDVKLVKAMIYKNESNQNEVIYGKTEAAIKIVVPPLAIDLKANGKNSVNVNLGGKINYSILYSNRGEIGMKDVIVKLKLESPIIDYEKINFEDGFYDSSKNEFTWKVSDQKELKRLEPGGSGGIQIEVPIKEELKIESANDKNYSIEAVATIDSSDIDYYSLGSSRNISSTVVAKLNSKVVFENLINYEDNDIKNSGPHPPKVGEETTYAMVWKIKNLTNRISDVKVYAIVPTWVKWKNLIFPKNEDIIFNERTHEIIWNVGAIENGVGVLNNAKEVKFQIGIVPEVNQPLEKLKILPEIDISGKDDFTAEVIGIKIGER